MKDMASKNIKDLPDHIYEPIVELSKEILLAALTIEGDWNLSFGAMQRAFLIMIEESFPYNQREEVIEKICQNFLKAIRAREGRPHDSIQS